MKPLLDRFYYWDVFFFATIFGKNHGRRVTGILKFFSRSADGFYYPFLPALIYAVAPAQTLFVLHAAFAAFMLELSAYFFMKRLLRRDRPFEALDGVQKRLIPPDQFSFPSGHTAAAFVVATLFGRMFPQAAPGVYTWAMLVGFSRIHLGLHYPTDVLAGMFLGRLCGLAGLASAASFS
jgi:undecaprenyl-diphosphatase